MKSSNSFWNRLNIKRLGIRSKMFALFYLLVSASIIVVGYYGYESARVAYREQAMTQIQGESNDASRSIMELLALITNDMNFVSDFYGLTRYLYWEDLKVPSKSDQWKNSTTNAFEAFMRNYSYLYKIRFLNNKGIEVINVRNEKLSGRVYVEKGSKLQDKRHEPYFIEAIQMKKGQLYVSPLDLNREQGQLEKPYVPVLRYARPIYGANNVKYGIAVINIYADSFFSFIENINKSSKGEYSLISAEGFYFYNALPEKAWGHLLGHHTSFSNDHPDVFAAISGKESGLIELNNKVISFTRIYPNSQDKNNYWYLIGMIDEEIVYAQLNQFITISIFIFIITLLLVFISGRFAINSLLSPLQSLTLQMQRLGRGELTRNKINYQADDEISKMLISSDSVISNMEALTTQVDIIAAGDYSQEVHVPSEKDKLSLAINNMTHTLKQNKEENELREWLSEGLSQFSKDLSGENGLQKLSEKAVSFIGHYVNAGHGVIYLYDDENETHSLNLMGSYMFTERSNLSAHYKLGEGAIGQVARERKAILLTDIPKEKKITTGTTSATPLNTFTFPLIYENVLCGVVEFASYEPFTELKQRFFNESSSILASLIYTAVQSDKITRLLSTSEEKSIALQESNTQMEEQQQQLQQQTEELQQSNAQMEEQQQQLQQQTEELQQSNAQMEEQQQQLLMQTAELEDSKKVLASRAEQLELSSRYKSEFLANMSHELRTPLNSVILLSKMMALNENQHLDNEDIKRATVIHNSGNELLRLINDILDLSKVEAGKFELIHENTDSVEIFKELNSQFEDIAKDKGLKLIIDNQHNALLFTDKNKLMQILRNLVSNALKFTKEGSVTLSTLICEEEKFPIKLLVTDTGIGIPEDKLSLIFNEFQQVDGSISREFGGTGLGLSICKRFAGLLNGQVTVESKMGEGSTFIVHLPKQIQENKLTTATPELSNIFTQDDRADLLDEDRPILVIDDDSTFCSIVLDINHRHNHKTIFALTGREGLELASKYQVAGIILDLGLPDMDGIDLLNRLKTNPQTKSIPIYIISGRDKDLNLLDQGAMGYLQKPVTDTDISYVTDEIIKTITSSVDTILIFSGDAVSFNDVSALIKEKEVKAIDMSNSNANLESITEQYKPLAIVDSHPLNGQVFDICASLRARWSDIPIVICSSAALDTNEEAKMRQYTDTVIITTPHAKNRLIENIEHFLKTSTKNGEHTLPLAPPIYANKKVLKGNTILVADDDARNLFVITSALEEHGAKVVVAVNGISALEKLNEEEVDLILMDLMMPEMDGYQAISKIREDDSMKHIPIIVLTAKALKEDREKCLAIGANDYLSKPVEYEALIKLSLAWIEKTL